MLFSELFETKMNKDLPFIIGIIERLLIDIFIVIPYIFIALPVFFIYSLGRFIVCLAHCKLLDQDCSTCHIFSF
jgi:hypothetical protein